MSTIKVFNKKDKDSIKVEIDGKRVTGIASLRIVAMANPPILVVQIRKNSAPPRISREAILAAQVEEVLAQRDGDGAVTNCYTRQDEIELALFVNGYTFGGSKGVAKSDIQRYVGMADFWKELKATA